MITLPKSVGVVLIMGSLLIARSLEDFEVEDFVLLATVDGDLYASDRKTGKELWHLEVDQPMVETVHHQAKKSILDEDYIPVDHYLWAVEPNSDGPLYVWIPEPESRPRATLFTMKSLVEELCPYAGDEPHVVYTGNRENTTMISLDAATGRIIMWFDTSQPHVNEAKNSLIDAEECTLRGTITLSRTTYTVGIQRREGGKRIATLKYTDWSANNLDTDLLHQYRVSLDNRYITSQPDGTVYGFDNARTDKAARLFTHKFTTPVARVFDVCRPRDAAAGSNPELIVLPQPPMPSHDETMAGMRSSYIFLNQTEKGSWYALSGDAYPLIFNAPFAQASHPEWNMAASWDSLTDAKLSKALVGTHSLKTFRANSQQSPTPPPGTTDGREDPNGESVSPIAVDDQDEPTIINNIKSLPQSAANNVVNFVRNPIFVTLFFVALVYNAMKFRRLLQSDRSRQLAGNI